MSDTKTLLIEIGTEELPPRSLRKLASAFATEMEAGLKQQRLPFNNIKWYATPRRLALLIHKLAVVQPDSTRQHRGPALKAAFDKNGQATKAAIGFAQSCNVSIEQLATLETDKGSWLVHRTRESGQSTAALVPEIIEAALHRLPIARRMRWGNCPVEFVRPVRWIVLLFNDAVIECEIFNVPAGNISYGHRFHCSQAIVLESADDYLDKLLHPGHVRADFDARRDYIVTAIKRLVAQKNSEVLIDSDLLEEVTALTEWPVAIKGAFDSQFLTLPDEVLLAVMQDHQKYFPVKNGGSLMPMFIAVSNVDSAGSDAIIRGNERVIHPRLSDAKFFWNQDCAVPLADHIPALKHVVYEQKLGSLHDKAQRIKAVVIRLAQVLRHAAPHAARAAELSKCDLLTAMVSEFPKLQGVIGGYYARHANEPDEVAMAIAEQYLPRFAGDQLPQTATGQLLAVADKIDTLSGMFAIDRMPTGDKDPFSLRRSALGVLRILIECRLDIDLLVLLTWSADSYSDAIKAPSHIDALLTFMLERLRRYYLDEGVRSDAFESVLAVHPTRPLDFHHRLLAVNEFRMLPEAASLAAANKRIENILRQAEFDTDRQVNTALLRESAEQSLAKTMHESSARITPMLDRADYKCALTALAGLKENVDLFFDKVMVMCEDNAVRHNRLALLQNLNRLFLKIADISRLQTE